MYHIVLTIVMIYRLF